HIVFFFSAIELCPNTLDKEQWDDHFSKCPEELMYYCIHGDCRYIKDQNTPSCRCQRGYIGSRCEYMDLDWLKGDKRQILIICVVTGLVLLILLLVFICICSHRRYGPCKRKRRQREELRNGSEKLHMMDTSSTKPHIGLMSESTETPHTSNTV
uniref:Betacellulin, epidermal growth factor family member n=1 Tax=Sphaeramia orbicularis TaxID=375764 RepID=A0A673CBB0_9TELE